MSNKNLPVLAQVKAFTNQKDIKERFQRALGPKAPQFMTSLVNAVAASTQLQEVNPNSIMAAAFVAASFDLPIDSNLGFAAIVPYNGYYEKMNYASIYEDELKSYNPITGEIEFVSDFSQCQQRNAGEEDKIIGYYAWFRLKTGFISELYMSREDVENHARKYSKAYQYDIRKKKSSSKWSTDFDAMAKKTVIKLLLSRWGILSIDMQKAITDDQKVFDKAGNESYGDNEIIDVPATDPFSAADGQELEEAEEEAEEEPEEEPEEIDIMGDI